MSCVSLSSRSHVDLNRTCFGYTDSHLTLSLPGCSLRILLILSRGTEQGAVMFKRCKGAAKALCTACQITFLMARLSHRLISVEKERPSRSGGGGVNHSLPCHSKITHSSLYLLLFLQVLLLKYFLLVFKW